MQDNYGREIDYLRVSITDRCNFRCRYCMPPEGVRMAEHDQILKYEELLRIISILGKHGVGKIRLTGGEPLVRKGLVQFVRSIKAIGTVKDLAITTNGSLLAPLAADLKAAGLDRVNISIDTLDFRRFSYVTGVGKLQDTVDGINSALEAGLSPVKLNVVLTEVLTRNDIAYFIDQVYKKPLIVRFIEYMPIGGSGVASGFSIDSVKGIINDAGYGDLTTIKAELGNGPARYYRLPGSKGAFGFITPISEHFCHECSRLRLTADGRIKPCLLSNNEVDVKTALRSGANDEEVYNLFLQAVWQKPKAHKIGTPEQGVITREMFRVGG